jgi:hypothetical protein
MITRMQPVGPIQAYKTYQIVAPRSHWRQATCAEVDCVDYLNGWEMMVHRSDAAVLHAIRTSGRPFVESPIDPLGFILFEFDAGSACRTPSQHRIQVVPEIYVVRAGDWRGNPTGMRRRHRNPQEFVEDFGEHQERIIDEVKRG